jgi:ABC-2 type transport system ATP-binding protein
VDETRVRVVDVSKRFGTVQALDRVSLEVAAGEVVVMIGVNGAGKSTLLRVLGTRVLPDGGEVQVAGFDALRDPREVRRRTGVVLSDERSWYWRLSGRQNLEFFGRLSELPRAQARARAQELLDLVQLSDAGDRRFDGYSSGMRSRLSLARALLLNPPVLLLDEPSRALDPAVSRELREAVVDLAKRSGSAVLWVTHDLHEAATLGDRVVVLDAGRIRRVETRPDSAEALEQLLDAAP